MEVIVVSSGELMSLYGKPRRAWVCPFNMRESTSPTISLGSKHKTELGSGLIWFLIDYSTIVFSFNSKRPVVNSGMQMLASAEPRFSGLRNPPWFKTLSFRAFSSSSSSSSSAYSNQYRGGLPRFFSEVLPTTKVLPLSLWFIFVFVFRESGGNRNDWKKTKVKLGAEMSFLCFRENLCEGPSVVVSFLLYIILMPIIRSKNENFGKSWYFWRSKNTKSCCSIFLQNAG